MSFVKGFSGSDVTCVVCFWEFDEGSVNRWRLVHAFACDAEGERLGPTGCPQKTSDWVCVSGVSRAVTRWDWGRGVVLDGLVLGHRESPFTDEMFVSRVVDMGVGWEWLLVGGIYLLAETTHRAREIVLGLDNQAADDGYPYRLELLYQDCTEYAGGYATVEEAEHAALTESSLTKTVNVYVQYKGERVGNAYYDGRQRAN